MKIEEVRPSFTVYLIHSGVEDFDGLSETLRLAGYMVASFSQLTAAFSEFPSNPPHFILLDSRETAFPLTDAIAQISAQLPESHIFLLTPIEKRAEAVALLRQGVYEIIFTPILAPDELLSSLDRAAERDYLMYLNERHNSANPEASTSAIDDEGELQGPPPSSPMMSEDIHLTYARQLFEQESADQCVDTLLRVGSSALENSPVVFFKYVANRRVLVATHSREVSDTDLNGIGIDFNESGEGFRTQHLREPNSIPEIRLLVQEVFSRGDFFALPVESLGEVYGIILFLHPTPSRTLAHMLKDWVTLLSKALSLLEASRRLHTTSIKDPGTDLANRNSFVKILGQEISRSRRTFLPVSLALCAIDQYGKIVSQIGSEEAQNVLRLAARIFERHSRTNDLIGRIAADEFAVLMPHTHKEGALIKMERMRRIIETADFSRALKNFPNLTVSIGVAEYPSLARDGEELIQQADQALMHVRPEGNKTCIAATSADFVPDFQPTTTRDIS